MKPIIYTVMLAALFTGLAAVTHASEKTKPPVTVEERGVCVNKKGASVCHDPIRNSTSAGYTKGKVSVNGSIDHNNKSGRVTIGVKF